LLSGEDKSLWDRLFSLWQQRWWNHARKVLLNAKTELSEKIDISRELCSAAEEMMPLLFTIMPRRQFTALSESNLTVNPYSAYSLFAVGAAKLFGGDRSGLEMLKFAYNKNESLCLEIRRAIKFYFLHFCSEAELKQFAAENAKLFANERGAVLSTDELLTPTDIEHRHKVPFVWASVITIRNDGLVSKIREIAAGSPLLRGAYMILETERCVLIIRYNRGWRKSECDEERLRFIETARSEVLLATGLPLYVFTESQVAPTRRLKRCYRNYAHKIK